MMTETKRRKIGACSQKRDQTFIELDHRNGLLTKQIIWPRLTSHGKSVPLMAFSFDNTLANTAPNYLEAGKIFASKYIGETSMMPSLEEFRRVHVFDEYSLLYDLGIPRKIPFQRVWEPYQEILLKLEGEDPSRLHPDAVEFLQDVSRHFYPVVVTSNKTHAIAKIIEDQAKVKVDVVVAPSRGKGRVLDALAEYHLANHGSVGISFNFFCSSAEDAASASECGKWVRPFGVVREGDFCSESNHRYYKESLRRNGATLIDPKQVPAVVYGYHNYGCIPRERELF